MAASATQLAKRALVHLLRTLSAIYGLACPLTRDSPDVAVVTACRRMALRAHPHRGLRQRTPTFLQVLRARATKVLRRGDELTHTTAGGRKLFQGVVQEHGRFHPCLLVCCVGAVAVAAARRRRRASTATAAAAAAAAWRGGVEVWFRGHGPSVPSRGTHRAHACCSGGLRLTVPPLPPLIPPKTSPWARSPSPRAGSPSWPNPPPGSRLEPTR